MYGFGGVAADLKNLFFPHSCAVCGALMTHGEEWVCNRCRWDPPLTGYTHLADNPVVQRFWGLVPVQQACAFFFFVPQSDFRSMIHDFKYHGRWRSAIVMGEWFGGELSRSPLYTSVDVVVPVPLHPLKRLRRGYNQSEYIAMGIARTMGLNTDCRSVVRTVHNKSQTLQPHHKRWENVEGIFDVRHPERLAGRHILLVDDVFTTGATALSCAQTIVEKVPDCRLSFAALATPRE